MRIARKTIIQTAAILWLLAFGAPQAVAGPIILAGHDADDHGFTAQYVSLFNAIYANVTNGGSGILAIGADSGSTAGNWIVAVGAGMPPRRP